MSHFQVRKISNVLQAQHFLDRLCKALKDAAAKEDLAEGKNGASKLTKEQIVESQQVLNAAGLAVPNWPVEWGGKEGNMNEPGHFVIEKAFVEK